MSRKDAWGIFGTDLLILGRLEYEYGFQFDDFLTKRGPGNYVVEGIGPSGEDAVYVCSMVGEIVTPLLIVDGKTWSLPTCAKDWPMGPGEYRRYTTFRRRLGKTGVDVTGLDYTGIENLSRLVGKLDSSDKGLFDPPTEKDREKVEAYRTFSDRLYESWEKGKPKDLEDE